MNCEWYNDTSQCIRSQIILYYGGRIGAIRGRFGSRGLAKLSSFIHSRPPVLNIFYLELIKTIRTIHLIANYYTTKKISIDVYSWCSIQLISFNFQYRTYFQIYARLQKNQIRLSVLESISIILNVINNFVETKIHLTFVSLLYNL